MRRLSSGKLASLGLGLLLSLGLAPGAWAQGTTARIEGIVTDESGGGMPGTSVTATNLDTNVARTVVTDAEGNYTLTALSIGPYKVVAELSGFKSSAATASLNVNEVARLDFKLGVGALTETVEVTAAAPTIEKSTSFIGTVIDRQQVEDLPLNGRNFTQLTTLSPGVTRGAPGSASNSPSNVESFRYGEFGGTAISVNGLREQFNTYLLDGIDNNESLVNGIAYVPSPEVIQEFRVITTNAPAEFGRAGGAIQNIVSKTGTNRLHGSGYYFLRPEGLASTPKFAADKPEFENQDFGATVGGPIVKDKTFFFGSYHGLKSTIPVEVGRRVTVPTARMRNGDFSELLNPALTGFPGPVTIYDPVTGLPFPGNVIPADRLNPVGRAYLNVFPLPTESGILRNYLTDRSKDTTFHDFDGRVDHYFSASDQLFVRASVWNDKFEDPGFIPGYHAGFGSGTNRNKGHSIGLGETHTFSSNVINELRVGYVNFRYEFLPVGYGENQNAALGIGGPGGVNVDNGIALIGGGDGRYIEYLGDFGQYQIEQRTLQLSDTVTWIRGNHAFKAGGTLMQRRLEQTRTRFGKGFYFYSDFLATPGNVPPLGQTGYEVADMLIGRTNFTATGNPGFVPREVIHWENSAFVQDDWRVNDRLTLNLGLRYDLFTPYYEADDKMANYDPATQSIVVPGRNGAPRGTVDTDTNNLGPRAGFAYILNPRTVVRGSYGRFYTLDRGGIDNQLTENPPSVVTEFRFGGPGTNLRLSEPIPLPTPVDPGSPVLPQGSGLVYIPRDTQNTQVDQWSLSGQRELTANTSLMLAYVGTRGENLAAVLTSAGFAGNVAERLTTIKYIGRSTYNGFQASLRRSASDLTFLGSYTLGFAKDNVPGLNQGGASTRGAAVTDVNNLDLDYAYADSDSRHRFTLAATYNLPFTGNRFAEGWSVNGVYTFQSGTPFTAYAGGGGALRVNQGGDPVYPETEGENYVQWVDRTAFSAPAAGTRQGTAERNSVRGPGINTLDLSVFKSVKLTGDAALELRLEGFNILDTPQYNLPNQSFDDQNFGRITGTRINSERQFQLAARLTF